MSCNRQSYMGGLILYSWGYNSSGIAEYCQILDYHLGNCMLSSNEPCTVNRCNQLLQQEVDAVENTRHLIDRRLEFMSEDIVRLTDVISHQYDHLNQINEPVPNPLFVANPMSVLDPVAEGAIAPKGAV